MLIPMVFQGGEGLSEKLQSAWGQLIPRRAQHGKPVELILRSAESEIAIRSEMHDIGPRMEVGVLEVGPTPWVQSNDSSAIELPASFLRERLDVFKLTIRENGVTAESGLAFRTDSGDELIIVAADYPYTLAFFINGAGEDDMHSEYPLHLYERAGL